MLQERNNFWYLWERRYDSHGKVGLRYLFHMDILDPCGWGQGQAYGCYESGNEFLVKS